jgi:hypothetical protein
MNIINSDLPVRNFIVKIPLVFPYCRPKKSKAKAQHYIINSIATYLADKALIFGYQVLVLKVGRKS